MAVTTDQRGSALAAQGAGTAGSTNPKTADPKPAQVNQENGSPEWWVRYLVNQLLARHQEYSLREAYFEGDHMLPQGDLRYMRALGHLRRLAPTNYIGLITTTPVERMQVQGFRFGDPGTADDDAAEIWSNSDMDLQSHTIHMNAAKYGVAYALVSPPRPGEKYPTITSEDPRCSIVYRDPTRPTKALAGLRMWEDEILGRILAVLYLPEGAYGFIGPYVYQTQGFTITDLKERLLNQMPSGAGFQRAGFVANPPSAQEVALTEYVWRPDTGPIPQGECGRDVRIIQDRINQTIFQRMCISHFQAYKQRWATGISLPKPQKGQTKGDPPFDPGFDTLWGVSDEKAKFGEFSATDITQILEAVRDDIGDIAALTKTPAHYLMGKMANISGETLTQAESGLVSKTQIRMSSMGWSHERVMKLCFAWMDDDRAVSPQAAVLWENPGRELIADTALAGLQWFQTGIDLALIMEGQGRWTQDQIAFAVAQKKIADQQALDQQNQQMQMQQDHQLALAKASGSAGPPGANKAAKTASQKQGAQGPKAPAKPASGATPKSSTPSKPVKPAAKP